MRKIPLYLLVLMLFAVSACQAQATPLVNATNTPLADEPSPQAIMPSQTPLTEATTMVGPVAPAGCTVVSQETDPAEESALARVSETDWAQGPEDAYVTIIEYGDFQ